MDCCGGRWRTWFLLAAIGVIGAGIAATSLLSRSEPDPDDNEPRWAWPGQNWNRVAPAEMRMDADKLKAFGKHVGGAGCVIRRGRLVHEWGETDRRVDLLGAAEPILTHLLLKSIERGRLGGLNDSVGAVEPRLADAEPPIRWRHLASQTAGYGATDEPRKAFQRQGFQTALLADLLVRRVHQATWETATDKVLEPLLTGPLRCRYQPAFVVSPDHPPRLMMAAEDLARVGWLYACLGKWKEQRPVTSQTVQLAIGSPLPNTIEQSQGRPIPRLDGTWAWHLENAPTDHRGSYSYGWWINGVDRHGQRHWPDAPLDTYAALGAGGRHALVVLSGLEVVAAWTGSDLDGPKALNRAIALLAAATVERGAEAGSAD